MHGNPCTIILPPVTYTVHKPVTGISCISLQTGALNCPLVDETDDFVYMTIMPEPRFTDPYTLKLRMRYAHHYTRNDDEPSNSDDLQV